MLAQWERRAALVLVAGALVLLVGAATGAGSAGAAVTPPATAPPPAVTPPATTPPPRTVRVAPAGVDPNGVSGAPSFAGDSGYLVFASQATNLGPDVGGRPVSNVYIYNIFTRATALISQGSGPANGPSTTPSASATGEVVAFASRATNLTAGTPRHIGEIFVRVRGGPIHLISVGFGGVQPDGNSSQPVLAASGRWVAFTSSADDLVPGDDNASSDVFVVDLVTGQVKRVSVSSRGAQANGGSYNPSISADGRLVSFTSDARNLVPGDRNRVADVFVHDLRTGVTRRVSVSSRGHEQNASVPAPFQQISDLSADGRWVVFDSNASDLARGDGNAHTNIFRHSLATGRTTVISSGSRGRPANNDSFTAATSADGSRTVFESFADNLASPWAPSENIFVRDATTNRTRNVDLTPSGGARGPEVDQELLQQAAISPKGAFVAFTSGADNLVSGDYNGLDDLFVRGIGGP